jgi:hypothetical protein
MKERGLFGTYYFFSHTLQAMYALRYVWLVGWTGVYTLLCMRYVSMYGKK